MAYVACISALLAHSASQIIKPHNVRAERRPRGLDQLLWVQ